MPSRDLAEDLAFARTLAEEGRQAPLLGGGMLVFWGALTSALYLAFWLIGRGFVDDLNGHAYSIVGATYGIVAVVGMTLLIRYKSRKPGKGAIAVRAERAIWASAGIGMWVVAAAYTVSIVVEPSVAVVSAFPKAYPSASLAFVGAALLATCWLSKERWLGWFACLSFAAAILIGALSIADLIYLACAIAFAATMLVPGLILMRREPASIA